MNFGLMHWRLTLYRSATAESAWPERLETWTADSADSKACPLNASKRSAMSIRLQRSTCQKDSLKINKNWTEFAFKQRSVFLLYWNWAVWFFTFASRRIQIVTGPVTICKVFYVQISDENFRSHKHANFLIWKFNCSLFDLCWSWQLSATFPMRDARCRRLASV